MVDPNRWEPKEPLDVRSWNLLPVTNVKPGAIGVAHLTWIAIALCSAVIHSVHQVSYVLPYVVLWLYGHMCIQYILDRLRGRRAAIGTAAIDNEETPFQVRVLADMAVCFSLLVSMLVMVVGISGVGSVLAFGSPR
jgi:hypothetical protein